MFLPGEDRYPEDGCETSSFELTRQLRKSKLSFQTNLNRELDRLYRRRTDALRTILSRDKPGPHRELTEPRREKAIRELRAIASRCLASKMWKRKIKKFKVEPHRWHAPRGGLDDKRSNFRTWVTDEVPPRHGKVYVFFRGTKCRYVGRTRTSGKRPALHFALRKLSRTTHTDVYSVRSRSATPLLECLAIHHFKPARNKIRAAKQKWCPRCPLCKIHKKIKTQIRQIFGFR
jgi:hypothetical protein